MHVDLKNNTVVKRSMKQTPGLREKEEKHMNKKKKQHDEIDAVSR